jgi:hypothetical protein
VNHGGGLVGSGQLAVMDGGGRRLGHEEVVRDPFEVGEGSVGAHRGLSMVVLLSREKLAMGAGTGGRRRCQSGR